jgi:hypothetical protein
VFQKDTRVVADVTIGASETVIDGIPDGRTGRFFDSNLVAQ